MSTYILWDVDGTLVRNGTDAGNLYHEAVELAAGHAIELRLPNRHGKTDGQVLTETLAAHGLPESLHDAARHHLDDLSRLRHERGAHRELCPGALEAVAATTALGYVNALLTGNSAERCRYKLSGAGFDVDGFDWQHSYFGSDVPARSDLTLRAAAELAGHRIVIIGDTPLDDAAAVVAGIPFIAVATGAYAADDLRETGAVVVVDDLNGGLEAVLAAIAGLGV